MAIQIEEIIDILNSYEIFPGEIAEVDYSNLGKIQVGESIYTTSIGELFHDDKEPGTNILELDDPRIHDWWGAVRSIIDSGFREESSLDRRHLEYVEPPEPHCAWYSPIHFFGHRWGIYIRENCILRLAMQIARSVDWRQVNSTQASIAQQLLRSAFYVFFLHEQFHHKVESFGFRLLIATGYDRYRPYMANVYRKSYLKTACLEESLANAESYIRLGEVYYSKRVEEAIRDGLKDFLWNWIPMQPPGYSEGVKFFSTASFRDGLYMLESQILDGSLTPNTPFGHWALAPNMITALKDITDKVYIILPSGAQPIFRSTSINP